MSDDPQPQYLNRLARRIEQAQAVIDALVHGQHGRHPMPVSQPTEAATDAPAPDPLPASPSGPDTA